MEVFQEYFGLPPPPGAFGPFLQLSLGDIVELTKAEAEQSWWEVGAAGPVRDGRGQGGGPWVQVHPWLRRRGLGGVMCLEGSRLDPCELSAFPGGGCCWEAAGKPRL